MDHRPKLQTILENIEGVDHVYFDPPVGTNMEYPCIRFSLNTRNKLNANDKPYIKGESYIITFITRNVSTATKVLDQLEDLMYTDWSRTYVTDGLHHYVYIKSF